MNSGAQRAESRWYCPPSPDFVANVGEELDSLTLEDIHIGSNDETPVWSPRQAPQLDHIDSEGEEEPEADTPAFRAAVLAMFSTTLALPGWDAAHVQAQLLPLHPDHVHLKRISGAFTNAVFFVSYKDVRFQCAQPPTLLLRVYGMGSGALLSRRSELLVLHTLSSLYKIGPHILGTFANGRVEEFYQCHAIGPEGMRDFGANGVEGIAHWVARRMRELHEVPLDVMRTVLEQGDLKAPSAKGFGRGIENSIMASSHHPRPRRVQHGPSLQPMSPQWSYSRYAHPSPPFFSRTRNMSTMSFDSLATSYDSLAMSVQGTPANALSPHQEACVDVRMSPLALEPSLSPPRNVHGPYPGVWRRLKRWMREASKVLELLNVFLTTAEGRAASRALKLPESLPVAYEPNNTPQYTTQDIRSTTTHFDDLYRTVRAMDLPRLCVEIMQFKAYVRGWERREGKSRRVFCHNDSQYGNLLKLDFDEDGELPAMASGMPRAELGQLSPASGARRRSRSRARGAPPYERLVVIDFEYASPNPRAYDIANHFHEWCADYHDMHNPWSLTMHRSYPTQEERRRWLTAYVEQGRTMSKRGSAPSKLGEAEPVLGIAEMELPPSVISEGIPSLDAKVAADVDRLEQEVYVWSPATHAVWGLWGIVFARGSVERMINEVRSYVYPGEDGELVYAPNMPETQQVHDQGSAENFDNLRYALGRVELFRKELRERHVEV
ncbi:hypothetical protein MVES_003555 [Malassezia vespertilionis]|uniref:Choline kinase N-terminal domain-containing protein n=1 Tax=Malassezia vespertilionis TaxID=2020962 RepID=A0A2N1J834_9BASI|nr:hypothetical protein MVES_003555 [Malassezia vespertilionis]